MSHAIHQAATNLPLSLPYPTPTLASGDMDERRAYNAYDQDWNSRWDSSGLTCGSYFDCAQACMHGTCCVMQSFLLDTVGRTGNSCLIS